MAKYNCKGLDVDHEKIVSQIKRQCDRKSDCRLDVLNWTACGNPIAHSDPEFAAELIKNRNEIHSICKYVVAPCAAVPAEAMCVAKTCETQEDVLKKNYKIKIKFSLNKKPLQKEKIVIDYDNGIRCATAPCPSRTKIGTFETNNEGMIELTLNELLTTKKTNLNLSPTVSKINLEQLGFIYQNQKFSAFNLIDYLAKNKSPFEYEVGW
jgi:hypothetical protein